MRQWYTRLKMQEIQEKANKRLHSTLKSSASEAIRYA